MRVGLGKPTVTMVIQMDEVGIQQLYVFSWKDVGPIEDYVFPIELGNLQRGVVFVMHFVGRKIFYFVS